MSELNRNRAAERRDGARDRAARARARAERLRATGPPFLVALLERSARMHDDLADSAETLRRLDFARQSGSFDDAARAARSTDLLVD